MSNYKIGNEPAFQTSALCGLAKPAPPSQRVGPPQRVMRGYGSAYTEKIREAGMNIFKHNLDLRERSVLAYVLDSCDCFCIVGDCFGLKKRFA